MTVPRMVGLLIALTSIGIGVVALRVDQGRHIRRIQELQFEQSKLQRELWRQDIELAQVRSPDRIRERAAELRVESAEALEPVRD